MDKLERLVDVYRLRASSSVKARLAVLMDLGQLDDPRVVPFLLTVLSDPHEAEEVRIYVLKDLRNGLVPRADRPRVAQAICGVLLDRSSIELRLQAALALGEFIDVKGVLSSLSAVSVALDESIDLRYAAFTAVEQAGPTPECIALLRQMSSDETLGNSARSVLSAWHVDSPPRVKG
jgi:HEAT repeat protein